MTDPSISHGRGGAANIRPDTQAYTDGSIVREGAYGDQGDGAFSTGRGGEGNIGSPRTKPSSTTPHDSDVIPETALRRDQYPNFHVGRGGEGNVHKDHKAHNVNLEQGHKAAEVNSTEEKHQGIGDKIKGIFGGKKD